MSKTAFALVIGMANYLPPAKKLKNSAKDARDIAKALQNLGFVVRLRTDISIYDLDTEVEEFGKELSNYDIGLFYYAGHAVQVDGVNYLTAADTDFDNLSRVKRLSLNLQDVLKTMDKASNNTSIIILDACRDNPFPEEQRSASGINLAPINAPKGAIIAYSTSPGQTALDGKGKNGRYTEALLTHIQDPGISIEDMFKRVRNSLNASTGGKQISWEHTSLSGPFFFNPNHFISSKNLQYHISVVADKNYACSANTLGEEIIESLRSHNFYTQNDGIAKLLQIDPKTESASTLFLIGRNILQSAIGNAKSAIKFISNLVNNSQRFFENCENHLVNGILFEIYFDSKGKFRYTDFKSYNLESIFNIQCHKEFKPCLDFIQNQLNPFKEHLFIVPNNPPRTASIDIITDQTSGKQSKVISVRFHGEEILQVDKSSPYYNYEDIMYSSIEYGSVKARIAGLMAAPLTQLYFSIDIQNVRDSTKLSFPYGYTIGIG